MASFKAYKHVGACPLIIDGHVVEPGTERFEAILTPELENFYLRIGAVEILPAPVAHARPTGSKGKE